MPTLRFYRGMDFLIEYRVKHGRMTIGRADTCDIALPGDTISRIHCIIDRRQDRFVLVDRSRHGTTVGGEKIDKATLAEGSVIHIGPYRIEVSMENHDAEPTDVQERDRGHEVMLETEDGVFVARAALVVASGPGAGRRFVIRHPRVSVGSEGSGVALPDPALVARQCWLRTSRGRVMIEPGEGSAFLDAERIRDVTPLYADETFRLGDTELRVEQTICEDELPLTKKFGEMVAVSPPMQKIFGTLRRLAGHHYSVLVIGESGTGKELIAKGLHTQGPRSEGPFIPINCGAVSETLFESELFGHEKGAFTGADRRRDGAFQKADGGTLFLDEVGELPEQVQAKLLRVLENGEVRRVGSMAVSHPDVRIVAATNRDLAEEVAKGRFREDLFFRLAVLRVNIPPLRDRPVDLDILCPFLCRRIHPEAHVTPEGMAMLRRHTWPGNVRELRNVLIRAFVASGPRIDADQISFDRFGRQLPSAVHAAATLGEAERAYLIEVLRRNDDNRSATARELGIARSTLLYKLKRHGIP